jgi:hypothetical protein
MIIITIIRRRRRRRSTGTGRGRETIWSPWIFRKSSKLKREIHKILIL